MKKEKSKLTAFERGLFCLVLSIFSAQDLSSAPKKKETSNEKTDVLKELVKFPQFRIPVVQRRQIQTYYLIEFYVECDTEEAAKKVYRMRPKVIDAVYSDLYGLLSVVWHPDIFIDLKDLKTRIENVCEKILGKDLFEKVLVQQFTKTLVRKVEDT